VTTPAIITIREPDNPETTQTWIGGDRDLTRRIGGLVFSLLVLFHLIAGSAAIGQVSIRAAVEDGAKFGQSAKWLVGRPDYVPVGHATVENQPSAVAESANLLRV
jgi:hypothetical protein